MGSWIAFMVLPGVLAIVAGCILVLALGGLFIYVVGAIVSLFASAASSLIGGLFTAFLVCLALVALAFLFPILVVGAIGAGVVVLAVGSLISCAVFTLV